MARGQQGGPPATAPARQNNGGNGNTPTPAENKALATTTATKELTAFLRSQADEIAKVLPQSVALTPERIIKLVSLTVHKTPKLLECTKVSILSSVLEASSFGFEIGGPMAEAHLVPFFDSKKGIMECTFMPDYKGILKLARNSKDFDSIEAEVVHAQDIFLYERTPEPAIRHKPCIDGDPGRITHAYAYAYLASGRMVCEVMRADEIEAIRQRSRGKDALMWTAYWGEGAKKTVLKRFLKRQSRSVEVARAIEADDRQFVNESGEVVTVRTAPKRGIAGLRQQLAIEADGPTLPPQPSTVYSEADDAYDAPESDDAAPTEEQPQTQPEAHKGGGTGSLPLGTPETRRQREPGEEG